MNDLIQKTGLSGKFQIHCLDKDGNLKWEEDFPNGIVNVGIAYLLDAGFEDGAKSTTWFIALIDNASFSALAAADTMAAHSGWVESSAYAASTRPTWTNGVTASRSMTNAATVDFAMNATATIKGVFITSNSTKAGTTGTLWSTAAFSSNAAVTNGDTLKITYTING